MCPSTPSKSSSSGSAGILKTNQGLRRINNSDASPLGPRKSTVQRVEVAQISDGSRQDPDIIYLKQPVLMSPVVSTLSHSTMASDKLLDNWQTRKKEQKLRKDPLETIDFVEFIPDRASVHRHTAKKDADIENTNGRAEFDPQGDSDCERNDSNVDPTNDVHSKKIPDTPFRDDTITTTIHSTSTITTSVVTNEGMNINVTVDANRKLTVTHRKCPDSNRPRYIVNAPIEIKIVLQDPLSSIDSQMNASKVGR